MIDSCGTSQPEFRKLVLEVLRPPLEDGRVTISRMFTSTTYPSCLTLVTAITPCPCGFSGDPAYSCSHGRSTATAPLTVALDVTIGGNGAVQSVLQVEDALAYAYGSRQVSSIFAPTNQYQVILELDPAYQIDPAALGMLYIRSKTGQLIPLETIAKISKTIGPLAVNHLGQLPAVTISFNLRPGVALGDAMKIVDRLAETRLPQTVSTSFQGTAQAFKSSFSGLWMLLAMAIFVIYVVLGVLYESYIHPVTILSGLPAAGFGALITLMLFKCDLNIYGFVGIIMLIGIVKKNAIMMIDFALEAERESGKTPLDAIYEGAIVRFRPIMMTTMAALMGTLPIAMGLGAGGESRQPLGLAVVGGLLTSQLLTLYITPVVYYYMDRLLRKVRRREALVAKSHAEL